jgi:hypothetical protein
VVFWMGCRKVCRVPHICAVFADVGFTPRTPNLRPALPDLAYVTNFL